MSLHNLPLIVQDHGTIQGSVDTVNFTSPASATTMGNIATVNVIGSSFTATQITVDFGSLPTRYKTFTIIDSNVLSTSHLMIFQAGTGATGCLLLSGTPASGQFNLIASSLNGTVTGLYKINYVVG